MDMIMPAEFEKRVKALSTYKKEYVTAHSIEIANEVLNSLGYEVGVKAYEDIQGRINE